MTELFGGIYDLCDPAKSSCVNIQNSTQSGAKAFSMARFLPF